MVRVIFAGHAGKAFAMKVIKQGDPAGPVLFTLGFTPLLGAMTNLVHGVGGELAAFADDVGLSVADLYHMAGKLGSLFSWIKKATNLGLNYDKLVVVPMRSESVEEVKEKLAKKLPFGQAARSPMLDFTWVSGWARMGARSPGLLPFRIS